MTLPSNNIGCLVVPLAKLSLHCSPPARTLWPPWRAPVNCAKEDHLVLHALTATTKTTRTTLMRYTNAQYVHTCSACQSGVLNIYHSQTARSAFERALDTPQASAAVVGVLTAIAFALRFYKINHPDQVVYVDTLSRGDRTHQSRHSILALTRCTLASLPRIIFSVNITSTSTRHSQNFCLDWLAGLLGSTDISHSRTSVTATLTTMYPTSACGHSPPFLAVSQFR